MGNKKIKIKKKTAWEILDIIPFWNYRDKIQKGIKIVGRIPKALGEIPRVLDYPVN